MGKKVVSWLDTTKHHSKLNPGKSLKAFLPAAQKEWKQIKAGNHPTKMAKPPAEKGVKDVVKIKKTRKRGKSSKGKSSKGKSSKGKSSKGNSSKRRRTSKRGKK